jgi:hypothetical protein
VKTVATTNLATTMKNILSNTDKELVFEQSASNNNDRQPQHATEWAQSKINPDLTDLGFRSIGQEIDSLTITREARGVK